MSISVNYILEQERKKKLQQEQKDVPGVGAIAEGRAQQEQSKPAEQQLNETAQPPQSKSFDEEYPLVYNAYRKYAKPKNQSMLPNPNAQSAPVQEDEEFPTVEQSEMAQATNPNKPESWSDEEYNAVRQLYSDEQIQSLYKSDPSEFLNGIISQVYKANTPQPKEPDEKQMERQARYAAIGDALSLFSQAAGAAQGAHLRERKFEEGAMARLTDSQQKLYNNYLTRADQYSRGLVNAQMQDYLRGKQNWKETQKGVSQVLAQYRKEKIELAKQAQKDALEREKLDNAERKLDASIRDSDRRLTIAEQNARTAAARAEGYNKRAEAWVRKLEDERANPSRGNNIKKHEHTLVIPAHPSDPNAYKNKFGDTVTQIGVSKADREYYANQAMKDKGFLERLGATRPDLASAASQNNLNSTQRGEIADAYMEMEYYSSFGSNPKAASGLSAPVQTPDPVEVAIEELQQDIDPDEEFPII